MEKKKPDNTINWKKVRKRLGKGCVNLFKKICRGLVYLCRGIKKLALKTVPFWKSCGRTIAALAKKTLPFWQKIAAAIKHSKAYPVLAKIGNFFKAVGAFLGKLSKPLQRVIAFASLTLVLALVLTLSLNKQAKRAATLESDPIEEASVTMEPEDTPEPTFTPEPEISVTPTPAPLKEVLKKGDDDPLIAQVQLRLMELGYMDSDEPTEHFGSITEQALASFQKHNGLGDDGILRELTYELLMSQDAKEYVMQSGDEGEDVKQVQNRLYELGYLAKSSITGTFGEKTAEAVENFQDRNGLKSDGKVGEKTLAAMYGENVVGIYYKKGDKNDTIKQAQLKLVKLGYLSSNYKAEGKMDSETVNALKNFQDLNELTVDGCLGTASIEILDSGKAISYTLRLGMRSSDVKDIQKRLNKLGYLKSSFVNGYYGAETEDAVEQFQKRNGLSADGAVGPKTLKVLESDSAKKPRATATPKPKNTPKATQKPGKATPKTTQKPGKTTAKPKTTTKPPVTPKPTNNKIDRFIEIAKTKLGCPYVRGAKGPNKFDCSGFVYWVLNQAGVKQGYMTSITWRSTTKYTRFNSLNDAKKGDVLVFKGSSMSTGHVGIYLGGGKMIDASSGAGQVRITSTVLSGSYWKQHFLMGYHIFD